jgi:hypothetical protein
LLDFTSGIFKFQFIPPLNKLLALYQYLKGHLSIMIPPLTSLALVLLDIYFTIITIQYTGEVNFYFIQITNTYTKTTAFSISMDLVNLIHLYSFHFDKNPANFASCAVGLKHTINCDIHPSL